MKAIKLIIIAAIAIMLAASCSKEQIPQPDIIRTEYSTKDVWFTLPPAPDTSIKYAVVIDLYKNHVAECSFIKVQKGTWSRFTYQINRNGIIENHLLRSYTNDSIPQHDTIVFVHGYSITFVK